MSQLKNHADFIQTLEHDDYSDPQTKRVSVYGWDANNLQKVRMSVDSTGKLNVNSSAPVGGATSAKQDSQIALETQISSLTETLQELVQRLAPLAGAMANTAQLRAVVTGAVTAAGGGYITSAQHIANTLTQTNSLIAYNRMVTDNLLATQANINNCVGA